MATPRKRTKPSAETVSEAMRIARANQRPEQTREQTKLIAQGIQKGIDQYKKQQKAKAREMDKRRKKGSDERRPQQAQALPAAPPGDAAPSGRSSLPWVLLGISWALFALYLFLFAR
jgi:hypothetical protein